MKRLLPLLLMALLVGACGGSTPASESPSISPSASPSPTASPVAEVTPSPTPACQSAPLPCDPVRMIGVHGLVGQEDGTFDKIGDGFSDGNFALVFENGAVYTLALDANLDGEYKAFTLDPMLVAPLFAAADAATADVVVPFGSYAYVPGQKDWRTNDYVVKSIEEERLACEADEECDSELDFESPMTGVITTMGDLSMNWNRKKNGDLAYMEGGAGGRSFLGTVFALDAAQNASFYFEAQGSAIRDLALGLLEGEGATDLVTYPEAAPLPAWLAGDWESAFVNQSL